MRARAGLVISTAAILAITIPWTRFQPHPHWEGVQWVPFLSPFDNVPAVLLNGLLFVPFGASIALAFGRAKMAWVLAAALVLSVGVEFTQVFSHGRFPSATDVVCNVTGAGAGYWLAVVVAGAAGRPLRSGEASSPVTTPDV